MALNPQEAFPGGSKERVTRAGAAVRDGRATVEDYAIIERWRAAHRSVLNTFQAILRTRTRGSDVVVAQRHKRRRTIFGKLRRYPRMQLARMDDVAGCRIIFPNIDELNDFRDKLHAAKFKHKRKNDIAKYDYIANPKSSGYRGIHDVFEYDVNSEHGRHIKGLLIEIQYRTIFQHAWATCVEVVGFITESQPKFDEGDVRYGRILSLASEIIARSYEGRNSCHPEFADYDLIQEFLALDNELGFMRMLRHLNSADAEISNNKNVILMFSDDEELELITYQNATDALKALFELEESSPGKDIVLVRANTSEEVRIAFKNYFSDARDFIRFIEYGCQDLTGNIIQDPATLEDL